MTCNSKSEGRDFVYVGADYIYLCPAGERLPYRYTNEEDGKTLRRYWTRRIDGSDPHVRRAPRTWPHRPTISVRVFTQPGSFSEVRPHSRRVRFTLTNGHRRLDRLGQKRAISGSHSILVATGEHWLRWSSGQPGLPQSFFISTIPATTCTQLHSWGLYGNART